MGLRTELVRGDKVWTLKLIGNVEAKAALSMWVVDSSATLLKNMIEAQAQKLIIDLTETTSMDSHALRILLNAQKEFSDEKMPIVLRNPNSHLSRLFRIMQFDRVFKIEVQ